MFLRDLNIVPTKVDPLLWHRFALQQVVLSGWLCIETKSHKPGIIIFWVATHPQFIRRC